MRNKDNKNRPPVESMVKNLKFEIVMIVTSKTFSQCEHFDGLEEHTCCLEVSFDFEGDHATVTRALFAYQLMLWVRLQSRVDHLVVEKIKREFKFKGNFKISL